MHWLGVWRKVNNLIILGLCNLFLGRWVGVSGRCGPGLELLAMIDLRQSFPGRATRRRLQIAPQKMAVSVAGLSCKSKFRRRTDVCKSKSEPTESKS